MKRGITLFFLGFLVFARSTLSPSPALAADPSVTVTIDAKTSAKVDVSATLPNGMICAGDKATAVACAAKGCKPPAMPADETLAASVHRTFDLFSETNDRAPTWLREGLTAGSLWCATRAAGAAPATTQIPIAVAFPSPVEIDAGLDPEGDTPNRLVWSGWQERIFVPMWAKLGAPQTADTCSIGGPQPTPCHVAVSASGVPGTHIVSISYSGDAIQSGDVKFQIGGHAFHAVIQACHLAPSAALPPVLFAGANLQVLELTGSPACVRRVTSAPLTLHKDDSELHLSGVTQAPGGTLRVMLENVPNPAPSGSWSFRDPAGTHLGTITLGAVQNPIAVRQSNGSLELGIHYDVRHSPVDLDQWQDGKSQNGMAVVTGARGEYDQYIQNTAALTVAPELLALANRLQRAGWEPAGSTRLAENITCTSQPTACEDLDAKYDFSLRECKVDPSESAVIDRCHAARRAWRVKAHSWEDDVWIKEDGWWRNKEPSFQDELGGITFAVFNQRAEPFVAQVELVDYDPSANTEVVLFRQYVQLAKGARYESVPLPLADALRIECGHRDGSPRMRGVFPVGVTARDRGMDVIHNGFTRAVEDSDVLSGNCRLHYSPSELIRVLKLRQGDVGMDTLKYYGAQELSVTVRRGEAEKTFPVRIDPTFEKEVELAIPQDAKNAIGIYTVSVSLKGPALPAVVWRTPQSGSAGSVSDLADLSFHANLRPRGPFGWKSAPIRAFLTLPVSFTGLRFPARPSELEHSSSSSNVQVTQVLGGALLAVEPWNYDTGRNPLPVPTRFVTGMNFYNFNRGEFVPSWVTGVSLTLPLIDLQKGVAEDQLSTDVALGFFWETDVAEKDWIHRGNHFLATFGVNLLSLFGSK